MKIVIVGAGINGLYLARKLAERGEDVTVFEKKGEIGKEVCSGLFSDRILEFIPESQKLIQNKIEFSLIHFPKKTLEISFSRKFFVMSHFELDNLVAELAENSGAKILFNPNVTRTFLVTLREEVDRVIGCDGALSAVRQSLNLPNPEFRIGIQGFIDKEDHSSFVETWPVKNGFIWKIPRGKETEYGIIAKPKEAKILFEKFLEKNNLRLEKIKSALIPQGLIIPSNASITLCGDAVGLTKPWSGGGVIWGLMAADLLLKNFPDFLKYQKELKKLFLPKIILSKLATKMAYLLGFKMPWLLPKNIKIESDFLI